MTGGVTPSGGLGAVNLDPDVPAQPQTTKPTSNNVKASLLLPILFSYYTIFPKERLF